MIGLNYHHLYYFRTIATEGSLAKAAKRLRVGQPALSMQLRQLEASLELTLFERRQRALHLTEAGRLILRYANEIFRLGDEMIESIGDRHRKDAVHVVIGVMDSVPKHFALKVIASAEKIANCHISVVESHWDDLMRELRSHRVDLVLANEGPSSQTPPGILARRIGRLDVCVFGGRGAKKLRRGFPASLEGKSFALPTPHSRLRHDVEHYFRLNNIKIEHKIEAQDTMMLKLLASHHGCLVPIAAEAARPMMETGMLEMVGVLPDVHDELWLLTAERQIANPVASKLLREFRL